MTNGDGKIDPVLLRALSDVLADRLKSVQPGSQRVEFPAPIVKVDAPTIDMAPVALALSQFADKLPEAPDFAPLTAAVLEQSAMIGKLAAIVEKQLTAIGKLTAIVEKSLDKKIEVKVEPIVVARVEMPAREKKTCEVAHSDGTKSTVTEK